MKLAEILIDTSFFYFLFLNIVQDTIQGTGWMEITLAFYGYYQPAYVTFYQISSMPSPNFIHDHSVLKWSNAEYYSVGLGYELVIFSVYILCLACIAKSVANGFKENISLGRTWFHRYSDLAFASWDFCIDKTKVANVKKKAILNGKKCMKPFTFILEQLK